MRHYKKGRKLGTDASHTKAMKKSLVQALFTNDRIRPLKPALRRFVPTSTASSPGPSVATCILAVSLSPLSVTKSSFARSLRRFSRACGPTVRVATLAS